MSLKAVAAFTHLGWATVKEIVKSVLAQRYARVSLKDVDSMAARLVDSDHIAPVVQSKD